MTLPLKPQNARFTDSQWRAIHAQGHNILVSASAGSGKTTVLTQRLVEKLKKGIHVDELLVVTFTDLAAREMRERIEQALKKEINQTVDPDLRRHLQSQILLLPQANISTIHAFCLKLIRRYFYLVDIDPVFRLMSDDTEILLLKETVWQAIKEARYEDSHFQSLAKMYSSDKYDDRLTQLVFSLYTFSRAHENPDQWLDQLPQLYDVSDIQESLLFQDLIAPYIETSLQACLANSRTALALVEKEDNLIKSRDILVNETQAYAHLLDLLKGKASYDVLRSHIKDMTFPTWKGAGKNDDDAVKSLADQAKNLRNQAKDQLKKLSDDVFFASQDKQVELLQLVKPVIEELVQVVKAFASHYQARKEADNVLEFSDLEHIALAILAPLVDGQRQASEAATYYQGKFHEVLIDEYQDVNRLQESILSWLSKGDNLFMVGDVKQSIYAFRLADPSLFLEKYEAFGQGQGGERIILAENFRSRAAVLDGTNFIFQQIMDKAVGQMDYDQAAQLVQGNKGYGSDADFSMELLLFEKESDQDHKQEDGDLSEQFTIDSKTEGELLLVAQRIQDLFKQGLQISEDGKKRPLTYKDIVLLVPTRKHNLVIQEIFQRYQLPLVVNEAETYFQRTEIMIMLALLKVIDNPYQDIPLAAVLRSPIVGLDENDLAAIRINQRTGQYYQAVEAFMAAYRDGKLPKNDFHQKIYDKLNQFLAQLENWRFVAHKESLVSLIWRIYEETYFLDYVAGLPSGKQRQANLHALYERARDYEKTRFKGLFQFIQFIERMQAKQKDLAEAVTISENEDAIRLMTIHGSKGLEFPVVFVLDMAHHFNLEELRQTYVFSEEYGLGTDYFDYENRWRYPTLAMFGMQQFKRKKLLAEEMRKLYVALTRAKEKLILVGSCHNQENYWLKQQVIAMHEETLLPESSRLAARSALDWVSAALVRHANGDNPYLLPGNYPATLKNHPVNYSIHFHAGQAIQLTGPTQSPVKENIETWLAREVGESQASDKDFAASLQTLTYVYPYQAETQTATYQAVSELKRLLEDPDLAHLEQSQTNRYTLDKLPEPAFVQGQVSVTGSDLGTSIHLIMQTLPLDKPLSFASLEEHLQDLVNKGLVQARVADKINRQQILAFYQTDFGKYLIASFPQLKREVPFSMVMEAKRIFKHIQDPQEKILIHGIVDGYVEEADGIVLYDFKTDYVGGQITSQTIIERYKGQLTVYAQALSHILAKPIKAVYLCLLQTQEAINLLDLNQEGDKHA